MCLARAYLIAQTNSFWERWLFESNSDNTEERNLNHKNKLSQGIVSKCCLKIKKIKIIQFTSPPSEKIRKSLKFSIFSGSRSEIGHKPCQNFN